MSADRRAHWEQVFSSRAQDRVSWFEASPETSLRLIRSCGLASDACILDVGAGASRLPDALLREGFTSIAVLDISPSALEQTRERLGPLARSVRFIVADVASWRPDFPIDLWHDRAVLHFLTDGAERAAYAEALRSGVQAGGYAVIAGFAPSGPERCSGLPVVRADQSALAALIGPEFELLDAFEQDHVTPGGVHQRFLFTRFRRGTAQS
ncbi:MAG: methyltransferase domain-containing protein [Hyphomicrobiaceae bacterium]|nr:methyltransferase domain-containing protein [Hyphomicrobiaceae bacterium]